MSTDRRFSTLHELREVIHYEWSVRHAWTSRRAALRGLYWTFVRRYAYEVCTCGRRVGVGIGGHSWWAPDALWLKVMPSHSGVLCPSCFTERAEAKGLWLYWAPCER